MSLALIESEPFVNELRQQFEWYVHETELDLSDALELAETFRVAVVDTLETLLRQPGMGRRRFPQFSDLPEIRSWRVNPPFDRFLIYYHVAQRNAIRRSLSRRPPTNHHRLGLIAP
jgi:plasmid stabilization system protein ParE